MSADYERQITIRIRVIDDSQLTNAELDEAFERVTEMLSTEMVENAIYSDATQESIINAEVESIVILHMKAAQ